MVVKNLSSLRPSIRRRLSNNSGVSATSKYGGVSNPDVRDALRRYDETRRKQEESQNNQRSNSEKQKIKYIDVSNIKNQANRDKIAQRILDRGENVLRGALKTEFDLGVKAKEKGLRGIAAARRQTILAQQEKIQNLKLQGYNVVGSDSSGNLLAIKGLSDKFAKKFYSSEVQKGLLEEEKFLVNKRRDESQKLVDKLEKEGKSAKEISKILDDIAFGTLPKQGYTPSGLMSTPDSKSLRSWIDIQTDKARNKAAYGNTFETRFFYGAPVAALLGVARAGMGVYDIFRHPVQTSKSIYNMFRHPLLTVKGMGESFTVDPVGTIVEFLVFSKFLDLAGKAAKRSPVGRFVSEELFIRSQPKEVRAYVREIIKGSKAQEALNPNKIKTISKVDFVEVKSLNLMEAYALRKALQNTESIVFGSSASRILSKGKTPIPKDVDLATIDINLFNKEFLSNIPKNSRINYKTINQKIYRKVGSLSEASDKIGVKKINNFYWDPILDVKPLNRLIPDKSIFTKRGRIPASGYVIELGFERGSILPTLKRNKIGVGRLTIPTQKIVKIDKINLVGFGEQTTRKGLGTLQVLLEKNVRRAKDPSSFLTGLKIQLESLKLRYKQPRLKISKILIKNKIKKLDNAINILESKGFVKLLEKSVPGLNKNYPILNNFNVGKLKKINVKNLNNKVKLIFNKNKNPNLVKGSSQQLILDLKLQLKDFKNQLKKSKTSVEKLSLKDSINKIDSTIKQIQSGDFLGKNILSENVKGSSIKVASVSDFVMESSVIPKVLKRSSYSILPKSFTSKLPGFKPSKLPGKVKSSSIPKISPKVSKLPKTVSSNLPIGSVSNLPVGDISKIPVSKLPQIFRNPITSILPKTPPSKLPPFFPKKPTTPIKMDFPERDIFDKKVKKLFFNSKRNKRFVYLPDLYSILFGIKASKKEKIKLLSPGRVFTGLEIRKVIK